VEPATEIDLDDCQLEPTLGGSLFGHGNPTTRLDETGYWRAWRTLDGPATLRIVPRRGGFSASAWGPGAARALAAAPSVVGVHDPPEAWRGHARLVDWARARPGLRLARVPWLAEVMWATILQQRVAFSDAARTWRTLVRERGEPAPGPGGLVLAPEARQITRIGFDAWYRNGVDRRRAVAMSDAAFVAPKIDRLFDEPHRTEHVLDHLRGIGDWSRAMFCGWGLGDPDAVPVGDVHLPRMVSKVLTGVPHGDDDKMLMLLEPFAGQRFRAIRLMR
jgi:3-methyladenine DNA glycosylase/8-oxoguanine DNA glycosylase